MPAAAAAAVESRRGGVVVEISVRVGVPPRRPESPASPARHPAPAVPFPAPAAPPRLSPRPGSALGALPARRPPPRLQARRPEPPPALAARSDPSLRVAGPPKFSSRDPGTLAAELAAAILRRPLPPPPRPPWSWVPLALPARRSSGPSALRRPPPRPGLRRSLRGSTARSSSSCCAPRAATRAPSRAVLTRAEGPPNPGQGRPVRPRGATSPRTCGAGEVREGRRHRGRGKEAPTGKEGVVGESPATAAPDLRRGGGRPRLVLLVRLPASLTLPPPPPRTVVDIGRPPPGPAPRTPSLRRPAGEDGASRGTARSRARELEKDLSDNFFRTVHWVSALRFWYWCRVDTRRSSALPGRPNRAPQVCDSFRLGPTAPSTRRRPCGRSGV